MGQRSGRTKRLRLVRGQRAGSDMRGCQFDAGQDKGCPDLVGLGPCLGQCSDWRESAMWRFRVDSVGTEIGLQLTRLAEDGEGCASPSRPPSRWPNPPPFL